MENPKSANCYIDLDGWLWLVVVYPQAKDGFSRGKWSQIPLWCFTYLVVWPLCRAGPCLRKFQYSHVLSCFSHVRLFAIPWTVAHQAPLSMGFSRQEYWSGLPFPPPGDLPDPGIELASLLSPALAGRFFTTSTTHNRGLKYNLISVPLRNFKNEQKLIKRSSFCILIVVVVV